MYLVSVLNSFKFIHSCPVKKMEMGHPVILQKRISSGNKTWRCYWFFLSGLTTISALQAGHS